LLFSSLGECLEANFKLKVEIQMYEKNNKRLDTLNSVLKDEHQALQLAFSSLEEKLRKTQVIYLDIYYEYLTLLAFCLFFYPEYYWEDQI